MNFTKNPLIDSKEVLNNQETMDSDKISIQDGPLNFTSKLEQKMARDILAKEWNEAMRLLAQLQWSK